MATIMNQLSGLNINTSLDNANSGQIMQIENLINFDNANLNLTDGNIRKVGQELAREVGNELSNQGLHLRK